MFWRITGAFRIHGGLVILPRRYFSEYLRAPLPSGGYQFASGSSFFVNGNTGGTIRVPLHSPKVIGVAVSRGVRSYQEDGHNVSCISIDPEELQISLKQSHDIDWKFDKAQKEIASQVVFVGIYDGHGGSIVSDHLRRELHSLFESVDKFQVPEVYDWVKSLGGYFKRFKGGALAQWVTDDHYGTPPLDLEARATLAFLQADRQISLLKESSKQGSTASIALFHTLDNPLKPFYTAESVSLTVAHCGDTRIILCPTDGGCAHAMTEDHHAEARVESARLRRLGGSGIITDSFGETRWMGALANTRGLGDRNFKPFGVTPEPEVRKKVLKGVEWAFSVSVSDGITSVLSDDEIVDLARNSPDPQQAASSVLSFAEELGSEDNATVIVVPLAGWDKPRGPDKTKELREYRRRQAVGSERQRRM